MQNTTYFIYLFNKGLTEYPFYMSLKSIVNFTVKLRKRKQHDASILGSIKT